MILHGNVLRPNCFLSYDGNGDTNKGTYMYYYTLVDDVLTLFYDDGEYKGAYKRQ